MIGSGIVLARVPCQCHYLRLGVGESDVLLVDCQVAACAAVDVHVYCDADGASSGVRHCHVHTDRLSWVRASRRQCDGSELDAGDWSRHGYGYVVSVGVCAVAGSYRNGVATCGC